MSKSAIGGAEAHQKWGNGADQSIFNNLPWPDLDIYQIAAGSLNSARHQMDASDLGSPSPHEVKYAYDHIRRLAYLGTQDFIETTLHGNLADSASGHSGHGDPPSSADDAGETEYVDPGTDEAPAPESQGRTVADLIGENWDTCVAPDSLYAWDSPAAYTAALYGEIERIDSAQEKLAARRPDIAATLISRDSIERESRELERVVQILNGANQGSDGQFDDRLATEYFPWNLPFIESFATIKAAFSCQGTSLGDLLFDVRKELQSNSSVAPRQLPDDIWLAYLGISLQERQILVGSAWAQGDDPATYFGHLVSTSASPSILAASETGSFSLDFRALCETLDFDVNDEATFLGAVGLSENHEAICAYFDPDRPALGNDGHGIACGLGFLDRLHRFIRLYRWLKLGLEDLVDLFDALAVDATGDVPSEKPIPLTSEQLLQIGLFCMLRSRYDFRVTDFRALVQQRNADSGGMIEHIGQLPLADRAWLQAGYSVTGVDLDIALGLIENREIKLTADELVYSVARLKLLSRIAQVPLDELDYLLTAMEAFAKIPDNLSQGPDASQSGATPTDARDRINRNVLTNRLSSAGAIRYFVFYFCLLAEWCKSDEIKSVRLNNLVVLHKNYIAGNIGLEFIKAVARLARENASESDALTDLARVMSSDYGISFDSVRVSLRQMDVSVIAMLARCANDVLLKSGLPINRESTPSDDEKFHAAIGNKEQSTEADLKYIFAILIQDAFIASCMSINSADIQDSANRAALYGLSPSTPVRPAWSENVGSGEKILLDDKSLNFRIPGIISMLKAVTKAYGVDRKDFNKIEAVIEEKKAILEGFKNFGELAQALKVRGQEEGTRASDLQGAYCYARLQKLSEQYCLAIDLLIAIVVAAPNFEEPAAGIICGALHEVFGRTT